MRFNKRVLRASVTAGATIAVAFLSAVGPAQASETQPPASDTEEVCWLNLDTGALRCFTDQEAFETAVGEQTGGPLLEAGDPAPAARAGGIQPMATYVLTTFYKDAGFSGSSLNATTSIAAMCSGYLYNGNFSSSWDNEVTSFQSYGGCRTSLFTNLNQQGAELGPMSNVAQMSGELNDTSSSYRIVD